MIIEQEGAKLTAVIDGVGDYRLEGSGVCPCAVLEVRCELQTHNVEIHDPAQFFGFHNNCLLFCFCEYASTGMTVRHSEELYAKNHILNTLNALIGQLNIFIGQQNHYTNVRME